MFGSANTYTILSVINYISYGLLHAHTCCLRNRKTLLRALCDRRVLLRALRQASPFAFSKSSFLFYCISYGLLRAPHFRNPTGIRVSAVFHTASRSYLLPSKSQKALTRALRQASPFAFSKSSFLFYCISYGLLRAPHFRNPTGIRVSAVFHTASRSYLLPSKSQKALTRALRATSLIAFSKSLYNKKAPGSCPPGVIIHNSRFYSSR